MSLTPLPIGYWRANATVFVLGSIAFACLGILFMAIGLAFLPELLAAALSSVFVTIVSFADSRVASAVIGIVAAIATFVGAVFATRWLLAWPRILKASEVPAGYVVLPADVHVVGGGPRSLGMASISYVDPAGTARHVRDIPTGASTGSDFCVLVDPARSERPIRYYDSFEPRG